MPAKLERCVARVKRDIRTGKLPKGSNAWAICTAAMKKRKTSGVADYVRGTKK